MKPQQNPIGIEANPTIQNRVVGGFVVSRPWEVSTKNLFKNIAKYPV